MPKTRRFLCSAPNSVLLNVSSLHPTAPNSSEDSKILGEIARFLERHPAPISLDTRYLPQTAANGSKRQQTAANGSKRQQTAAI